MRIIKEPTVAAYWSKHPLAKAWLQEWVRVTRAARWTHLSDVKRQFPTADEFKVCSGATVTCFNVKGKNYRLIVAIHYNIRTVYVRDFLTHAQYSTGNGGDCRGWKKRH
jgi:mRNA interferase HigB